jgi:hypothetical protein
MPFGTMNVPLVVNVCTPAATPGTKLGSFQLMNGAPGGTLILAAVTAVWP